ncbi:MAG: winged helix-turn-helix domain-containing protein [Theionarchaea archaeon]|nr:winged helix-turn-helix domain-containing protein [Theionarchaea archaeon]
MNQIFRKTLDGYFQIYEQIYEDPFIPLYQITKNTKVSRSTVSRYVKEMYELSILQGPFISVKPTALHDTTWVNTTMKRMDFHKGLFINSPPSHLLPMILPLL